MPPLPCLFVAVGAPVIVQTLPVKIRITGQAELEHLNATTLVNQNLKLTAFVRESKNEVQAIFKLRGLPADEKKHLSTIR